MELNDVIKNRFSCRAYLKEKIDRSQVSVLVETAINAPSACNLQLTQYIFVDDEKILKKLSQTADQKFSWAPCFFVVLSNPRLSTKRNSAIISAGMAAQNILLKATDLGLGTCPLTGFKNDKKIKEILKIPRELKIIMLIACGYVDKSVLKMKVPKNPFSETIAFNSYAGLLTLKSSNNPKDFSIGDLIDYRRRIAPVYLDSWRLNIWPVYFYDDALRFLKTNVLPRVRTGKIIDLISYDAIFLKLMSEDEEIKKNFTLVPSDYLKNNLVFYKKYFQYEGIIIDENNLILTSDNSADLITFVFKAEFTADIDQLFVEAAKKLKKGGYLFLAVARESWFKRLAKFFLNKVKLLGGEKFNIYENNSYYKIGFNYFPGHRKISSLVKKPGLKLISSGMIKKYKKIKVRTDFYLIMK